MRKCEVAECACWVMRGGKKNKKFCPLAQQRHHSPSTFWKIRTECFSKIPPLAVSLPPSPSRPPSPGWKIMWNQRQNVTWEAVRPSSGQPQGVKSMSGTTESLSDVLSVSWGHFSTWQHGKKRGRRACLSACVCARMWVGVCLYSSRKVEKTWASPLSTSHPLVDFNDLSVVPYWLSHGMSKHRKQAPAV